MPTFPTPIRAALGLAATAVDEARKLPETLPQLPVAAIASAMQASLRVQQQIAAWAARGDEVLSQLHGTSEQPPAWATFDETPQPPTRPTTAFDRIGTGFTEHADDEERAQPRLVTGPETGQRASAPTVLSGSAAEAGEQADLPSAVSPATKAGAKKAGAKKAGAKKAGAKEAAATKAPAKKAPAKKAAAGPVSEPLEEAARRADPSEPPNPSTMAAEIMHAQHEADADTGAVEPDSSQ